VLIAALPWRQLRRTYWAGWVGILHSSPLRRLLSHAAQVFPVDADRDPAGAMRTARDLLSQGLSVVWFPEGWRSPTGELQSFQSGVGLLLQQTGATAVPTALYGTFAAWPKQRRLPRFVPVRVAFGAARKFSPQDSPEQIRDALEQAVRDLLGNAAAPGASAELRTRERHD
jgi:long-chain acyl-CoA synthetase